MGKVFIYSLCYSCFIFHKCLSFSTSSKKARTKKLFKGVSLIISTFYQRCSIINGVLRNFAKFTAKHLCQSLFFNKVAGLRVATLLKKRLCHRCFPVNFAKFLIISILIEHLWCLLLDGAFYKILSRLSTVNYFRNC